MSEAAPTTAGPSAASPPSEQEAGVLAHVQQHWEGIKPNSPIYGLFFRDIRIVSATGPSSAGAGGRILARLPLGSIHINSKKILHGAVSAALVDWAGGMAIAAATGLDKTGVSVDIHVTYVSAAREGDELEVEAWTNRAGRTLAYTSVEIRKAAGGDDEGVKGPVVATGSHTKYLNITG